MSQVRKFYSEAVLLNVYQMKSAPSATAHVHEGDGDPPHLRKMSYELLNRIFVLLSYTDCTTLPYDETNIPYQVTLSQVCSKWRTVALDTGELWNKVRILDQRITRKRDYAHCLFLYRTWINRAAAHPLTVVLLLEDYNRSVQAVFQDFVLPFQIQWLTVKLKFKQLAQLSNLPVLNIEALVISLGEVQRIENFAMPPFTNKTRCIYLYTDSLGWFDAMLKKFHFPWHQISRLQIQSFSASLSSVLNILKQAPSLMWCRLTIFDIGSGHVKGVSMPSLRTLKLTLLTAHPDIVIPLLAAPSLTELHIYSVIKWSLNTYDILRRHHKLHQLQRLELYHRSCPIRIAQVLADAPMIHELRVEGRPIVDAEALEGIASGRLGCCLSSLYLSGRFGRDLTRRCLDMIEARQQHVNEIVAQASSWRQNFTGLKFVEIRGVNKRRADKKRVVALREFGTTVMLFEDEAIL